MTRRPLVVFAVLAALTGGLAGCSSGGQASPGASPSAGADLQRSLEIGRQFAQCARDHGYPNFPDPVIVGDGLGYRDNGGGTDVKQQAQTIAAEVPECKAIWDQFQALSNRRANPTPDPADLPKLREFAKCLRAHGLPDWPDPKADGTFPIIGTPLEHDDKSERFLAAIDACKQHYDKRISIS